MNKGGDIEAKDNPYIHDHNNLTYPCKACAFEEGHKAGEQQGIEKGRKEVVDSFLGAEIHSNPHSMLKAFNKILKAWQAFLKGIDKEE